MEKLPAIPGLLLKSSCFRLTSDSPLRTLSDPTSPETPGIGWSLSRTRWNFWRQVPSLPNILPLGSFSSSSLWRSWPGLYPQLSKVHHLVSLDLALLGPLGPLLRAPGLCLCLWAHDALPVADISALAPVSCCSQVQEAQATWPRPTHPGADVAWKAWVGAVLGRERGALLRYTHLMGARRSPDSCCPRGLAEVLASRVVLFKGSAGRGFWGGFGLRVPCNQPQDDARKPISVNCDNTLTSGAFSVPWKLGYGQW